MKKVISVLILLIILLVGLQFGLSFFKKGHEISYTVDYNDRLFEIYEDYQKSSGDSYNLKITIDNNNFYYVIANSFNKQKRIVKKVEYFKDNDDICIYPVLENGDGTYLECIRDNKLYTSTSFGNKTLVSNIEKTLEEMGYTVSKVSNTSDTKNLVNSTIYTNNILNNDTIIMWSYKGIHTISKNDERAVDILDFDKYENTHGYLVKNYYIIPKYTSSKLLEFSSVNVIYINNYKIETVDLGYTLSSNTYVNGVIDNKIYYTDPNNLLQLEFNPVNKNISLIGSKRLGGKLYDGNWTDANIYDFVNNKILYSVKNSGITAKYDKLIETDLGYYYNVNNEVYFVSKKYLDNPVLLFKGNISNFIAIYATVYFVSDDTLYYFNNNDKIIPILKNNELRYNKNNRISIYRKS